DYLNYVKQYLNSLDQRFDLSPSDGYGEYLFFAYLTRRFDTSIVKKIWEYYRDGSSDPMTCIEHVLMEYGTSWCSEYERFGAELAQTGNRFGGSTVLPDAPLLPPVPVAWLPLDSTMPLVTEALTLQFAGTGAGGDTCIEVIARDTDRSFQSDGSV